MEVIFKYTKYEDFDSLVQTYYPQNLPPVLGLFPEDVNIDNCRIYVASMLGLSYPIDVPNLQGIRDVKWRKNNLGYHHIFNTDELQFYRIVLSYYTRPTSYFTPNGIVTVNYNPDIAYLIDCDHWHVNDESFYEYIQENIAAIERNLFIEKFSLLNNNE